MSTKKLKVLVLGSGGREHAILQACLRSPIVGEAIAAPGNGGMARDARCVDCDPADPAAVTALAKAERVDFVIVGPEAPLCAGVVDALESAGIPAYGPRKAGAILEGSKAFTKEFLFRHSIPCARSGTFTDCAKALAHLRGHPLPVVVKASGLAAGKGVVIAQSEGEAADAVRDMMEKHVFGGSGDEVVIEEYLDGEEASIHVLVSDGAYVMLPASQDHKRVGDGDTGPNTGGMGAYAPAAVITPALRQRIEREIVAPTIAGFRADDIPFRGTLFIGIMATASGPKVLEFNVRFGDPETQTLLPLFASDPVEALLATARGTLDPAAVRFRDAYAVAIVMAAEGYPGDYRKGDEIALPADLPAGTGIVHAGTKLDARGRLLTSGGRVLSVTACNPSLAEALRLAYDVADRVTWRGAFKRRDIAARQLRRDAAGPR